MVPGTFDELQPPSLTGSTYVQARTRKQVLQAVHSRPGINKTELMKRSGLSWGTVGHHLRMLERDGLINLVRVGRTLHAAPVSFTRGIARAPVLTCPDARRILSILIAEPFARGATDLGRVLGMTRKQVRRHLYELVAEGLAENDGAYHPRYRSTRTGMDAANHLAVVDFSFRDAVSEVMAV